MKEKLDINIPLPHDIRWHMQKNELVTGLCEQSDTDNQNGLQLYNQPGLMHTGAVISL